MVMVSNLVNGVVYVIMLGLVRVCLNSFAFLLVVGRHLTSESQTIAVCYFDLKTLGILAFEIHESTLSCP